MVEGVAEVGVRVAVAREVAAEMEVVRRHPAAMEALVGAVVEAVRGQAGLVEIPSTLASAINSSKILTTEGPDHFPYNLRFYNSQSNVQNPTSLSVNVGPAWRVGLGWRHNYERRIDFVPLTNSGTAFAYRPDGKVFYFSSLSSKTEYDVGSSEGVGYR